MSGREPPHFGWNECDRLKRVPKRTLWYETTSEPGADDAGGSVNLDGRTVVVTGATSGIGRATAVAMGEAGAHVALVARTAEQLQEVAEAVRTAGGTAAVHPADLTDTDAVVEVAAAIRGDANSTATEDGDSDGESEGAGAEGHDDGAHDHPTVLVNAAGAGSWRSILEVEPGEVWDYLGVPFVGAFELTRELLPGMLRRREGRIVNVESPAGYAAIPGATGYVASRFALRGFSEALHADLHSTPVGVSSVVPGPVDTEYFERNDNVSERLPPGSDLRRLSPDEVAEAIVTAVEDEQRQVVLPPEMKLAVLGGQHAPDLTARFNAALSWQPEPEDWRENDPGLDAGAEADPPSDSGADADEGRDDVGTDDD